MKSRWKLIPRFWLHSKVRKENGEKKLINFKTFTGKLMLNFFFFHSFKFRFLLLLKNKRRRAKKLIALNKFSLCHETTNFASEKQEKRFKIVRSVEGKIIYSRTPANAMQMATNNSFRNCFFLWSIKTKWSTDFNDNIRLITKS